MRATQWISVTPGDVVLAWARALNARDLTALAPLYAPDAIGYHMAAPCEGQVGIMQMLQVELVKPQAGGLDVVRVAVDGEWAILEWKRPSRPGDMPAGCSPSDPKYHDVRGCTFFHIREGRIAFHWSYWNRNGHP